MNVAVIDIVFAIILLFFMIRCVISGFIRGFFSKIALLLGAFAGLIFYRVVTPFFPPSVPVFVINIASFLIVFISVYLAIRIIEKIIGLAFKGEIMGGLDRALGLFLGIFEGLLIISLIIFVLTAQRFFDPAPILKDSVFFRLMHPIVNSSTQILKKGIAGF